MCRLAAYIGPEIRLDQFLLRPDHALPRQAMAPREMSYARFNADGFGVAWFDEDGQPVTYLQTLPIWSDPNLPGLARSLFADLWLAHVRAATLGDTFGLHNTQPFTDSQLLFAHNGFIEDFAPLRRRIREYIDPAIDDGVAGRTDSSYVFALIRHLLADDEELDLESAIAEALDLIDGWVDRRGALMNLVLSDGERLVAVRHAVNHDCPSLYYTIDDEAFPDGQLLASERLTDSEYWQPVPPHHILVLDPEQPPELLAL